MRIKKQKINNRTGLAFRGLRMNMLLVLMLGATLLPQVASAAETIEPSTNETAEKGSIASESTSRNLTAKADNALSSDTSDSGTALTSDAAGSPALEPKSAGTPVEAPKTATPFTTLAPGEKEKLERPLSDYEKSATIQKKDEGKPSEPPTEAEVLAKRGSKVTFHILMKLESGKTVFDSKADGRPWKGVIGDGTLIGGIDLGLRGMAEGGKRSLWIPAHMAYGANGIEPQIPPHAKLYAEIEVIKIEDPDDSK